MQCCQFPFHLYHPALENPSCSNISFFWQNQGGPSAKNKTANTPNQYSNILHIFYLLRWFTSVTLELFMSQSLHLDQGGGPFAVELQDGPHHLGCGFISYTEVVTFFVWLKCVGMLILSNNFTLKLVLFYLCPTSPNTDYRCPSLILVVTERGDQEDYSPLPAWRFAGYPLPPSQHFIKLPDSLLPNIISEQRGTMCECNVVSKSTPH